MSRNHQTYKDFSVQTDPDPIITKRRNLKNKGNKLERRPRVSTDSLTGEPLHDRPATSGTSNYEDEDEDGEEFELKDDEVVLEHREMQTDIAVELSIDEKKELEALRLKVKAMEKSLSFWRSKSYFDKMTNAKRKLGLPVGSFNDEEPPEFNTVGGGGWGSSINSEQGMSSRTPAADVSTHSYNNNNVRFLFFLIYCIHQKMKQNIVNCT